MVTSDNSIRVVDRPGFDQWPLLRLYQRECGQRFYSVANLVYLQSKTNYTWLNWKEGKRMLMPRTLKFYEPQLPTGLFLRLHRNCLVNKQYIMDAGRDKVGPYVLLTTNERLPVSRRRWTIIKRMVDAQTS